MKPRLLPLMAALLCATLSIHASAFAQGPVVGRVPGRITITLKAGLLPTVAKRAGGIAVDVPGLQTLADRFGVTGMARLYPALGAPKLAGDPDLRRFWNVDFPPSLDLDQVLKAYAAIPEVDKAEAIDICRMFDVPNDPGLSQQYYLRNLTLGGKDVRAVGGWAAAHGDSSVIVAIVDSGVDWHHPDLGGSGPNYRRGAIWTNWAEANGTPGVDDDGDGYIDDSRGWDFVDGITSGAPGEDCYTPDNDPSDFGGHGTGCAGCVAGIGNNATGIAGEAYGCKILPVRAGWLGADGIGYVRMDFCSQAMIYAASRGAKIINCSWGSTNFLATAVNYCVNRGVLIVTAAGNDNTEDSSGCWLGTNANVIAVAAIGPSDTKASFSNYGTWVELAAPGTGIYTSWFLAPDTHTYASVDGTSFSSPITCGAAALIWSAHPGWTKAQVIAQLEGTADSVDGVNPAYVGKLGYGRPNLLRALGNHFQKVPAEFPSLLDAMNEASPGDTVAVRASYSPALVPPDVPMIAKEIQILGGWNDAYTSRDPVGTPTVINAALFGGAGLTCQAGATPSTVIDGFRITGGMGQIFATPVTGRYGGGVILNGTSPTLRNLDVTGNSVGSASEFGGGGGILLLNSNAVLDNVRVHGNGAIYGGGIFVYLGSPVFQNCHLYDNALRADNPTYPPRGGGLYVTDATATLTGCEISGHRNADAGGGIWAGNTTQTTTLNLTANDIHHNAAKTKGAGLYMGGTTLTMRRDHVHDNGKAAGATFMNGGGFMIENAAATLDSLTCQADSAQIGAAGQVTGSATATIRNSVFTANRADFFGGGLALQTVATGEVTGNTIAANWGGIGGGGMYVASCNPAIARNIVALNTGGATFANGIHGSTATPTFSCNDAWSNANGNYSGLTDPTGSAGNVALDPLFCAAGNYALQGASPAAPGNSGGCGLIGALAPGCAPVGVGETPVPLLAFHVEQNAPNPFNPVTVIRFTLPEKARTTLRVYDVAGRLVRTLVDGDLAAGPNSATWNGRDDAGRTAAAGVYFYRLTSGSHEFTGRMAMVK